MRKKIIYFFLFIFTMTAVQAAPIASTQQNTSFQGVYNINIPDSAMEFVSEKDLVEVFCNEAKYQGGEAIANVEALNQALGDVDTQLKDINLTIDYQNVSENAQRLRNSIEAICEADTLEEAEKKADEFKDQADEIKVDLQTNLLADLQAQIEKQLLEVQDELKTKYEEELNKEADELVAEKKAYYEKLIRAEAEIEQQKIQARLQAEIEEELTNEYAGQEDIDMEEVMRKGKEMGMARGEAEGKKVEERLRAKYEKIAEEEKQKLQELMEEKAKAKEAEMREKYSFLINIDDEIQKIKTEKYNKEWAKYHEKANYAKLNVVKRIIEGEFAKAKNLIENQRAAIDQAYKENMAGNYGIPSAEELLREIETDRAEIISLFTDGDTSEAKIAKIKRQFSEKWEKIRTDLEKTKNLAVSEVIKRIQGKTNWKNLKSNLLRKQKYVQAQQKEYNKARAYCQKNPQAKVNKYGLSNCVRCRYLDKEYKDYAFISAEVDQRIRALVPLIDRLDTINENNTNLDQVLAYKNNLVEAINRLKASQTKFKQISKTYNGSVKYYQNICSAYK